MAQSVEASGHMSPSAQRVSDFLSRIRMQDLALSASRCGAHARALQYYESHLRSTQGGALNPSAHKSDVTYRSSQVGQFPGEADPGYAK